ncbi:MAG: hypothetical protein M1533_02560 [Candidatus Thermoplasmatota archaeon]|jgi:hypothetical protein|nr:hypothetical protein [Candidatus Thermoplasmatota archaeon]MCL5793419.1 hypothetical protein [Candidatus Thermoplasmatota archaeon]
MNWKVLYPATFLLLVATSFACAYGGLWYLEVIPSAAAGYLLLRGRIPELLSGLAFALGITIELLYFQASYRLGEGGILAGLIGLPGGFVVPLILTLLISFIIGFFGAALGASFSDPSILLRKGNGTGEKP